MDEQELEKQFEATDYDEKGNITQTPPPPVAAKKKRVTTADLKKDITEIEDLLSGRIPEILTTQDNRLDNQDEAIGALVEALKSNTKEISRLSASLDICRDWIDNEDRKTTKQREAATEPELVFAQPPTHPEQVTATKGDIEAVASVCQTMTDVLMICRALKAIHDLPDEDRTYLLTTACRAAGVPLSPGLQIRAGATSGEV